MPIYNFRCRKCNAEFEDLVSKRGDIAPCPKCGSEDVEKQVSLPAGHVSKSGAGDFSCADGSCSLNRGDGYCPDGSCPF